VEGLSEKLASLLHKYSVLPFQDKYGTVSPLDAFVFTNYIFFLAIAFTATLVFFIVAANKTALVPKGIGNLAETGVEFIRNLCVDSMGKEGAKFVPFIGTLFFFLLFANLLGLVPGTLPATGTIGVTAAWAIMVFLLYNYIGIKKHGFIGYFKSFVPSGVREMGPLGKWGMGSFIFILEVLGHFLRPLTLAMRLFANTFAGGMILGIFAIFVVLGVREISAIGIVSSGLSFVMLVIMYAFKLFVGVIQAYIFTLLTTAYIGGALHADEH